jgi:hypothetical protein
MPSTTAHFRQEMQEQAAPGAHVQAAGPAERRVSSDEAHLGAEQRFLAVQCRVDAVEVPVERLGARSGGIGGVEVVEVVDVVETARAADIHLGAVPDAVTGRAGGLAAGLAFAEVVLQHGERRSRPSASRRARD